MPAPLILASASPIRAALLRQAQVPFEVQVARIDEEAVTAAMLAEGAPPRDVADALADLKAARVAARSPDRLVLGCDQVLDLDGALIPKCATIAEAEDLLRRLRGRTHRLLSAAVLYEGDRAVWRHVGVVRLSMRPISDAYLADYLSRTWDEVRDCLGCYRLEDEGVRLFDRIEGDYFTVLGMPLLEILSYLTLRGTLPS